MTWKLTIATILLYSEFKNCLSLATGFMGQAKTDSSYKRLQRFLREFDLDYYSMAKLIVGMMDIPEPWVLSINRTEWKFGQKMFNILTLGIIHQGVAFPLLWWMLDKRGNSKTIERVDLFKEFVEGQSQMLSGRKLLWGHQVYVHALRLEDNSLLIVIAGDRAHDLFEDYSLRWGIETLFGIFKSRGFNLEDTHLQDSERKARLLALLTIALCWAHRTGQWLCEHQPITIKKHGRKAKSIFRYGFDYLRRLLFNLEPELTDFYHSLRFLSCT
jgi:Transposase DDE domain